MSNILGPPNAADPYSSSLSGLTNGAAYGAASQPVTTSALQAAAAGVTGKQIEGKLKLQNKNSICTANTLKKNDLLTTKKNI